MTSLGRSRRTAALAAALAVAGVLAVPAAPAHAKPTPTTLTGSINGTHTVTLLSGDQVKLAGAGGHYTITTRPARRPDGRIPNMITEAGPNGAYVMPDDALQAVRSGRLDRELFNVSYLAKNGYSDDASKQLPVIVQYPSAKPAAAVRSAADALPASTPTLDLPSIHGAALTVPKSQAGAFWSSVVGSKTMAPKTLSAGLSTIWLDRKATATLDQSVPLIGAPIAWKAGQDGTGVKVAILDTGVDLKHPDLSDRIAGSQSFVPDQTVQDGFGHGTHVASIIAGSGAASGGRYKGVAPGAQLLIGKVLDNSGSGAESWIIQGMQWAAGSGAKVVNMSLGAGPTAGNDPLSQAVDDLTASTGTLFVIAAGNDGPADQTVAAPGAADAALTVAATDKSDKLADFSSRGPRVDDALKPDIAGPGVSIVAARASGTSLGAPVGDYYTTLSGTSMATPHVAGSAAILAEKHPDWKAAQLKAALMSTAKDDGYSVYQQGSGRVDIGRADTQQVFATTANLDYGSVDAGQPPAVRTLTYTNTADQPITLDLATSLSSTSGTAATADLSAPASVTVPAGGTASVQVTLASAALAEGDYSGAVTATSGSVHLTTPVGLVREPPKFTLTIHTLGIDGQPTDAAETAITDITGSRVGDFTTQVTYPDTGVSQVRVPVGSYGVYQNMFPIDPANLHQRAMMLINPQVSVSADTDITLDARKAKLLSFQTPRPAESSPGSIGTNVAFEQTTVHGDVTASGITSAPFIDFWITPTQRVTKGSSLLWAGYAYAPPEVTAKVLGPHPQTLHPIVYPHDGTTSSGLFTDLVPFDGTHRLALVDAGTGTPEAIAGKDLHGKVALLDDDQTCAVRMDRLHNLRDAGAAAVLVFPSAAPYACVGGPTIPEGLVPTDNDNTLSAGIAYASLPPAEARALQARLATQPVTLEIGGTPQNKAAYGYDLMPYFRDQVPSSLTLHLTPADLVTKASQVHAVPPQDEGMLEQTVVPGELITSSSGLQTFTAPATLTRYVGPLYPDAIRTTVAAGEERFDMFDRPGTVLQRFGTNLVTPGVQTVSDKAANVLAHASPELIAAFCGMCRQGNAFYPMFFRALAGNSNAGGGFEPSTTHLYSDGKELPQQPGPNGIVSYTLPPGSASYELKLADLNTTVDWRFRSAAPTTTTAARGYECVDTYLGGSTAPCAAEPLVYARYDLGATQAPDNTVPAGRIHAFHVQAYHALSTTALPRITGLKLWYSTDDGAHWKQALVTGRDGDYTAIASYPALAATKGAVSLRTEAWDAAGDHLLQTTLRAFPLR